MIFRSAQEGVSKTSSGDELPDLVPSNREKVLNFGAMYAKQWAFYLVSQAETIHDEGRIENISENFFHPHFDRDNLENNVLRHTAAGGYYYLFFRARGYSERRAFFWTAVSSTAFEFTVETLTEPPSYQDLFVTPLLGTAFGMGVEDLSRYLRSQENWFAKGVGFLINPSLILSKKRNMVLTPITQPRLIGARVEWEF